MQGGEAIKRPTAQANSINSDDRLARVPDGIIG